LEAVLKTSKWIALSLLSLLACGGMVLRAQQSGPDLILSNGKIITVDERFTIAQAVAIRGERVVAVGTNQEIAQLATPNTRKIDLKGKSVVPGMIDNHMHLLRAAGTWLQELRFDGVFSRKQAIDMIRARAKSVGPGKWVFNIGGWTTQQFTDDAKPFTLEELDQIAPENPVGLQESYYQIFLNSKGLAMLGIEAGKPDPTDFVKNSIKRDASDKPTGIIKGDIAATRPFAAKMPKAETPEQLEAGATALIKDMNRAGLTSFGVAGCNQDVLDIFKKWKDQGRLNVRTFCIGGPAAGSPEQVDRSIQQMATLKYFQGDDYIDNIFFGESVYTPLHDPMFAVKTNYTPDQLTQWRRMAMAIAKSRFPLHVHTELETTIDQFLDQVEAVNKEYPIKNLRWAFVHMNQVTPPQLERMKKMGMYLGMNPWGVINSGNMHDGFGDRAYDMPPLATIQNSGIMWGFGTDATAANQYMPFVTLSYAVTGKLGGVKVIRQTISREDALIAHTRKDAFFVFHEDDLGAIQPGKLADLVVLDRDYLTIPADQIRDIRPVMTMVGGRIVYEADAPVTTTRAAR
jgi:predicted amidohydrolase YtcJ